MTHDERGPNVESRMMLRDKTIVIVGGTTGLGLSAARACITAGARVVVSGRNPENAKAAQESLGKDARVIVGDATNSSVAGAVIEPTVILFLRPRGGD